MKKILIIFLILLCGRTALSQLTHCDCSQFSTLIVPFDLSLLPTNTQLFQDLDCCRRCKQDNCAGTSNSPIAKCFKIIISNSSNNHCDLCGVKIDICAFRSSVCYLTAKVISGTTWQVLDPLDLTFGGGPCNMSYANINASDTDPNVANENCLHPGQTLEMYFFVEGLTRITVNLDPSSPNPDPDTPDINCSIGECGWDSNGNDDPNNQLINTFYLRP
jgi:hypothetical protein